MCNPKDSPHLTPFEMSCCFFFSLQKPSDCIQHCHFWTEFICQRGMSCTLWSPTINFASPQGCPSTFPPWQFTVTRNSTQIPSSSTQRDSAIVTKIHSINTFFWHLVKVHGDVLGHVLVCSKSSWLLSLSSRTTKWIAAKTHHQLSGWPRSH